MNKHPNVTEFLDNSVWLSTESQMNSIRNIADSITAGELTTLRREWEDRHEGERGPTRTGMAVVGTDGVARMEISGTIMPRGNMFMMMSGGTSAEMVASTARTLRDMEEVHTVFLNIDTHGGNAQGLDDAAAAIRELREEKRVIALANHNVFSAGYFLAAQADRIFVKPDAEIGSIGTLMILQFAKEEDKERTEIIRSVPGKASVNPFEDLSPEDREKLQETVNFFHTNFVEAVAKGRNISIEQARKMADGSTHIGQDAVTKGFADDVVANVDEVFDRIEDMESTEAQLNEMKTTLQDTQEALVEAQSALEERQTRIDELEEQIEAQEDNERKNRAVSVVEGAIEDQKIPAARRDEIVDDLVNENLTFDAFDRLVSNISAGSTVPDTEDEVSVNTARPSSEDPNAPSNEYERTLMRSMGVPALKEKYDL